MSEITAEHIETEDKVKQGVKIDQIDIDEKFGFNALLYDDTLNIEANNVETLEKYVCIIDKIKISDYKFVKNIQELYKLIKESFSEKEDKACSINSMMKTDVGVLVGFHYEFIISFDFTIELMKIQEEDKAITINGRDFRRIQKTIDNQQQIIVKQMQIIEDIQQKLTKMKFYDEVLKYMYIPVYRVCYKSKSNIRMPFLNLYMTQLTVKYIDEITGDYFSRGVFVNQSVAPYCQNLEIIQCQVFEIIFGYNVYLPYIPKTFKKLILRDNSHRNSFTHQMFIDSCNNLEEIQFIDFESSANVQEVFVKLVENNIMNPSKITIKIKNSPIITSHIHLLRELGFTVIQE